MPNNVKIGTQVTGVGKSSSDLDKLRDKFDKLQKQGAKGFAIGAGAAITAKGFGLLDSAASTVIDVLGKATEAALAEEESVAKLGAALKANIPNWDGQTDAIEKVLQARMDLGFSDDEQRQSLALLVAATHDATKALEIQRTAMDLARLKGISLADASNALIKVEAGQFRVLKSLGIVLKDGATQTEALAAVQKVAAGQAAAYAETNRGKLLASQIKVDEAMERLGSKTMPIVVDAMTNAADAVELFVGAIDTVTDHAGAGKPTLEAYADVVTSSFRPDKLIEFAQAAQEMGRSWAYDMMHMKTDAEKAAESITTDWETTRGSMATAASRMASSAGDVGDATEEMADDIKSSTGDAAGYYTALRDSVVEDTKDIIDDAFDPLETKMDALANHYDILAGIVEYNEARGKEAHNDAAKSIIGDLDDEAQNLVELGEKHELTAKQVDTFEADVTAAFKAMGKKVPPEIQKVIAKLRTLASYDGKTVNIGVNIAEHVGIPGKLGGAGKPAATGGVRSGATLVGEEGPEIVDLPAGSYVHTAQESAGMMAKGGGDTHYHLTVMGDLRARDGDEVFAAMRRLERVALPVGWHTNG